MAAKKVARSGQKGSEVAKSGQRLAGGYLQVLWLPMKRYNVHGLFKSLKGSLEL